MKTKVSLVKCAEYETSKVYDAVRRAVDLAGGMPAFVKSGEKILIKPNLLSAREPERAITTHPEVVRAVIRLLKEIGATPYMGDSPGGAIKGVERVWERTGMKKLSEEEGVELINFETSGAVETPINHSTIKSIHITKKIFDFDGIINVPKLKTHGLAIFTGAVKNLYGCVPGLRKAEYHKLAPHPDEFAELLSEIYLSLKHKIRLNVIDGIVGMEGNGPSSGDLRKLDMILASSDGPAMDTAITYILGHEPSEIDTIKFLRAKKAGETEIKNIEITGENPGSFNLEKFRFPANWYMKYVPHFFINLLGRFLWMKPKINEQTCVNCKLCVESCPVAAIDYPLVNSRKSANPVVENKICISCLCCHELCPYKAIELKSGWLARILIRQ